MNKSEKNNLIKTEKGVSILIFSFTIVALFAFIAMAIDSANLFLAMTKMQNIGDSADMTALNVRIERGPQMRDGADLDCPYTAGNFINETCVKDIVLRVGGELLKQNLTILGFSGLTYNASDYSVRNGAGFNAVLNYIDCRPGGTTSCVNPETGNAIPVDTNNEFEYFTTRITFDVPLLLMHTVPFQLLGISAPVIGNSIQLRTTSHTILPALNVAVLADISGSMTEISGGQTKLQSLQTALTNFFNNFRPDRDKVSFWPFNLQVSPTQSVPVTPNINEGFVLGDATSGMLGAVNALVATGNTNPTDALLAAYEDFRTRGGIGGDVGNPGIIGNLKNGTKGEYTMVLFSDGAPTGMTARFDQFENTNFNAVFEIGMRDPTIVGAFNDIDNPDYLTGPEMMRALPLFSCTPPAVDVLGVCVPPTTPTPTIYTFGMPSPFYRTSITKTRTANTLENTGTTALFGRLFNKADYNTVLDTQTPRSSAHINPSTITSNAQNLENAYPPGTDVGNFLGFRLPTIAIPIPDGIDDSSVFANEAAFRNQTEGSGATIQPIGFKKQFYNNLIAMSDFIRSQNGYLYTVGVGTAAAVATTADPYQNVRDNNSMKVNLLARVAGDENAVTAEFGFTNPFVVVDVDTNSDGVIDGRAPGACSGPSGGGPNFTTAAVTTDCGRAWRDSPRKGENINTDDATNLDRIFQRISRQLQTKVVADPKSRIGGAGG